MKSGRVVVRTCVGCRTRRPKADMVRFVVGGGRVALGNADGRGTYVCRAESCLEKVLKRRDLRNLLEQPAAEGTLADLRRAVQCGRAPDQGDPRQASRGASGGGLIG
jgi:hypothetical protein